MLLDVLILLPWDLRDTNTQTHTQTHTQTLQLIDSTGLVGFFPKLKTQPRPNGQQSWQNDRPNVHWRLPQSIDAVQCSLWCSKQRSYLAKICSFPRLIKWHGGLHKSCITTYDCGAVQCPVVQFKQEGGWGQRGRNTQFGDEGEILAGWGIFCPLCWHPCLFYSAGLTELFLCQVIIVISFLADQNKARGCSTKTVVIDSLRHTSSSSIHFKVKH